MSESFNLEEEEGETGRPPGGFPRRLSLHAQAFVPGADGHHLGELSSSLPGWLPAAWGEYYANELSDDEDDDSDDGDGPPGQQQEKDTETGRTPGGDPCWLSPHAQPFVPGAHWLPPPTLLTADTAVSR